MVEVLTSYLWWLWNRGKHTTAGFEWESEIKSCKALCAAYCSELLGDENNGIFPAAQCKFHWYHLKPLQSLGTPVIVIGVYIDLWIWVYFPILRPIGIEVGSGNHWCIVNQIIAKVCSGMANVTLWPAEQILSKVLVGSPLWAWMEVSESGLLREMLTHWVLDHIKMWSGTITLD